MMPIPIFLPMNSGGGPITLFDVLIVFPIIIICLTEIIQIFFATIRPKEYKSIWEYFYWWIPVLPPLLIFIRKLNMIGKNKED